MKLRSIFTLTILAGFMFCGKGSENFTVETIDGVNHVHNILPEWGTSNKIELEFVGHIGEIEGEDEDLQFYLPEDIAVDKFGNIYILDAGNYRVQKLNPEGGYITSFGREGQGPGEFSQPQSIEIDAEGLVYISDAGNNRIEIFDTDGKHKESIRFDSQVSKFFLLDSGNFLISSSGGLMFWSIGDDSEDDNPVMKVIDREGNTVTKVGELEDFGDMYTNMSAHRLFFAVDNKQNYYSSFRYLNQIEKYSAAGKKILRIDRPLNFDAKIAKAEVKESEGSVSIRMGQTNTVSSGISVDDKGRIWVATLNRQLKDEERVRMMMEMSDNSRSVSFSGNTDVVTTDMYDLEIFSAEGILLGKIALTHFCDGVKIFGSRLFIMDKMRGNRFSEYRIVEK